MLTKIHAFLNSILDQEPETSAYDDTIAIACLLCEVSHADQAMQPEEVAAIENSLCKLLSIDKGKAKELIMIGKEKMKSANSLFNFTSKLSVLDGQSRINLISEMWKVAYADYLDPIEEAIIRKVAKLIYVEQGLFI
ncbi:hypothetical protein CXF72_00805 [Psychromonas sp. MB-3u-54]|uniref:tellurite resistance TerB family protein n=1 Tax=Psychromonas sp. MB-3u-54 TaxID=2058319 RepID=UPI000C320270|nr:TerB family tellurite resistance protein [Psychromonas sp. MB-3u-54]PKH04455.1 hypothetical protein CXF72_00805 [Psychromonas sp. MB-3u-54]